MFDSWNSLSEHTATKRSVFGDKISRRSHVVIITESLFLSFYMPEFLLPGCKLRISDTTLRYAPFRGHWPPRLASLSVFSGTQTSSNHRISIKRILQMQMRKIFFTEHSKSKFHEYLDIKLLPSIRVSLGCTFIVITSDIYYYCFEFLLYRTKFSNIMMFNKYTINWSWN